MFNGFSRTKFRFPKGRTLALSSVCLIAQATAATAQAQDEQADARQARAVTSDEIVVTARRREESLQDIPVSVQAITGEQIKKLSITQPEELSKLAPGLNISSQTTNGQNASLVLRGVRWSGASGSAAIPVYINELDFGVAEGLTSLFDVGQIEVLRGPQGTARGSSSISGAITLTTRRPDLYDVGGYAQAILGSGDHQSFQAAAGVPIIKGILAIRLATSIENSPGNRVTSIHNAENPHIDTRAFRASALFQPTDSFKLNIMYQRKLIKGAYYSQVAGTGSPGNASNNIPANYNGPDIGTVDYLSVQDLANRSHIISNIFAVNATWDIIGQTMTYNYGRSRLSDTGSATVDLANAIPTFDARPNSYGHNVGDVHEIRLASQPGDHFFDYAVGYYNYSSNTPISFNSPAYLPGAFGITNVTAPGVFTTPNSRYTLPVTSLFSVSRKEASFYGNVQLHLPYDFELTAGLRRITDRQPINLTTALGGAYALAIRNPAAGFLTCERLGGGLVTSPPYAGYCDFPVAASVSSENYNNRNVNTVYNVSLSRKFSDSFLAYATVGSSYRAALPAFANPGLPNSLLLPEPEKATSYEVGIKTNFGRAFRINLDAFQIDYKGQLTTFQGIPYFNTNTSSTSNTSIAFFRNVDARVRGIEVEIFARPLAGMTLNASASYARISSRGGIVPCNDPNRPITAANPINTCPTPKGQTINPSSPFQASLNGEYERPLGQFDGYVRFNVNFQGASPNYGTSVVRTSAYALVDLFAGITGNNRAWDIGAYTKNLFNEKKELTRLPIGTPYSPYNATGYQGVTATLPREIGLTLRYSFGSR